MLEVGGPAAAEWYGVTAAGNWEGRNILFRPLGAPLIRPPEVEAARQALFARREGRVRPGLDDKVLTEWNAMAVAALAEAGAALADHDWIAAARGARRLPAGQPAPAVGRAMAAQLAGRAPAPAAPAAARHLAYAADHAWLVEAFVRLAEATGRARWIGGRHRAPPMPCSTCSSTASPGRCHMTGRRRRDAHRPARRQPGRGRAVGQLGRRRRPAAAGRAHRSGPLPRRGPRPSSTP